MEQGKQGGLGRQLASLAKGKPSPSKTGVKKIVCKEERSDRVMIRLKRKSKAVTVLLVMAMLLTLWPGAAFTAAPTISGAQMDNLLAPNYIRVLVNFSEGIYTGTDGTSGTGAVSAGDFALTVAGNGGAVT
ncbi:MAG TPA: hypothetical protein DCZ10_05125, partial [Pelotomaculum sp.]|nr:hypothetical protein [Pelotomaculum sp.]